MESRKQYVIIDLSTNKYFVAEVYSKKFGVDWSSAIELAEKFESLSLAEEFINKHSYDNLEIRAVYGK